MAPLYEYFCKTCGSFEAWRPMREANEATSCPSCQIQSRRVLSAPYLASGSRARMQAQAQAAAPRLATRAPQEPITTVAVPRQQRGGRPWQLSH